jgi:nucleoside recognition membrane protein YjiH
LRLCFFFVGFPILRYTALRNFGGILDIRVVGRAAGELFGVLSFVILIVFFFGIAAGFGLNRAPLFSVSLLDPVASPIKRTPRRGGSDTNAGAAAAAAFLRKCGGI